MWMMPRMIFGFWKINGWKVVQLAELRNVKKGICFWEFILFHNFVSDGLCMTSPKVLVH